MANSVDINIHAEDMDEFFELTKFRVKQFDDFTVVSLKYGIVDIDIFTPYGTRWEPSDETPLPTVEYLDKILAGNDPENA